MSKKQIVKNIKKENNNKSNNEQKDNYFKFITTLAVLLIVFVISYFLIGVFYTKEISFNNNENDDQEVYVDNSTIMIGQLFDQVENEYYVLVYDTTDKIISIPSWLNVYKSKENALTVYIVDSSKKFNANYIVDSNSNPNANNLSDLRVISPTLIKVSNKSISSYIEGEDNIVNVFKGN